MGRRSAVSGLFHEGRPHRRPCKLVRGDCDQRTRQTWMLTVLADTTATPVAEICLRHASQRHRVRYETSRCKQVSPEASEQPAAPVDDGFDRRDDRLCERFGNHLHLHIHHDRELKEVATAPEARVASTKKISPTSARTASDIITTVRSHTSPMRGARTFRKCDCMYASKSVINNPSMRSRTTAMGMLPYTRGGRVAGGAGCRRRELAKLVEPISAGAAADLGGRDCKVQGRSEANSALASANRCPSSWSTSHPSSHSPPEKEEESRTRS
eukprot:216579-Hanusia_phi.AAC.4